MARARNIKPGFFTNDDLAEVDPLGRLLFIGLWTIADFKGDLEWRPKRVKAQVLPFDDCDVNRLANNLEQYGFIRFYSRDGMSCVHVVNFEKHQNPHKNERASGSGIPAFSEEFAQAYDSEGLAINRDKNGTARVIDGTAPADSLLLNPSSLIPDSLLLIPDPLIEPTALVADATPPCPHDEIVSIFNERCPALPRVRQLTDSRRKAMRARWREDADRQSLDWWRRFFDSVTHSTFLSGGNDRNWTADFDWLMKPANFVKVTEGKYQSGGPQRFSKVTQQNITNLQEFVNEINGRG